MTTQRQWVLIGGRRRIGASGILTRRTATTTTTTTTSRWLPAQTTRLPNCTSGSKRLSIVLPRAHGPVCVAPLTKCTRRRTGRPAPSTRKAWSPITSCSTGRSGRVATGHNARSATTFSRTVNCARFTRTMWSITPNAGRAPVLRHPRYCEQLTCSGVLLNIIGEFKESEESFEGEKATVSCSLAMKDLLGGDESQVKLSESLFGFAPIIITLLYKGRLTSLICYAEKSYICFACDKYRWLKCDTMLIAIQVRMITIWTLVVVSIAAPLDINPVYEGLHSECKYTMVSAGRDICFAREEKWLVYDKTHSEVKEFDSWEKVLEEYSRSSFRPQIIFFERIDPASKAAGTEVTV